MHNHILIKDPTLNGWEYGMLRSFENAIVQETAAQEIIIPTYEFAPRYLGYFGQGMKRGIYRKHFPRQTFDFKADTAWHILMGPENYRLDLYKNWTSNCRTRILYLYDTLPSQYPLIKRLFSNNTWDILITSFNDAVDDLNKLTGRKWHCVEQAADDEIFQSVPLNERLIHFSSYGRRYPVLHDVIKDFCKVNGLYYDYTTHDARHPVVEAAELYKQYAWHLSHSVFTLSWPVELTNPDRAGHLHPITCRWFEAAAAGTLILGLPPDNIAFKDYFGNSMVQAIDPREGKPSLYRKLETIWGQREVLFSKTSIERKNKINSWTWNERVKRIVSFL